MSVRIEIPDNAAQVMDFGSGSEPVVQAVVYAGAGSGATAVDLGDGRWLVVQTVTAADAATVLAEWDARGGSLLATNARLLGEPAAAALAAARGA